MTERGRPTTLNGDGIALLPGTDRVQIEHVETAQLASLSHELWTEHGARLADLFAQGGADGRLVLRSVYALDGESRYVVLEGELEGDRFPPLSDLDPAAFVEECEIYEQYGVRPDNGKRLNRVLVPPHHAERFPRLGRREGRRLASDYEPHVVSGEAFEFPFGPVRVVGWESLYMGLVTTGEEVLDLYLFHWHKHRGIERRLTGLDPDRATFFVERADGLSSVGDTLAFCRAVEMATGTEVPPAAIAFAGGGARARADLQPRGRDRRAVSDHRPVGRSGAQRDRARAAAAPEPGGVRPPLPVRRRVPWRCPPRAGRQSRSARCCPRCSMSFATS